MPSAVSQDHLLPLAASSPRSSAPPQAAHRPMPLRMPAVERDSGAGSWPPPAAISWVTGPLHAASHRGDGGGGGAATAEQAGGGHIGHGPGDGGERGGGPQGWCASRTLEVSRATDSPCRHGSARSSRPPCAARRVRGGQRRELTAGPNRSGRQPPPLLSASAAAAAAAARAAPPPPAAAALPPPARGGRLPGSGERSSNLNQ